MQQWSKMAAAVGCYGMENMEIAEALAIRTGSQMEKDDGLQAADACEIRVFVFDKSDQRKCMTFCVSLDLVLADIREFLSYVDKFVNVKRSLAH